MAEYTIGVVDDDEGILREVRALLEGEEFTVRAFSNGAEALGEFSREPPSLAILDIKMPHLDGIELLSQLRKVHVMPVIFLTSKDDEVDEVLGFRMGADDYIRKPFSPRLLVERVRTLLRRVERQKERGDEPVIRYGDLTLDAGSHQCDWKGRNVNLTVTEFLVLKSLALQPGRVKTREQLMDAAYGDDIYVDDRSIDSHIKRVRRKFREIDDSFAQIETLYGVGYRYREDVPG
ncbi:MAG TPA: response regulator transcription factor [Stellaceae bacterium]|nr:response regulator transcription factor [Stellaceae bacterium]